MSSISLDVCALTRLMFFKFLRMPLCKGWLHVVFLRPGHPTVRSWRCFGHTVIENVSAFNFKPARFRRRSFSVNFDSSSARRLVLTPSEDKYDSMFVLQLSKGTISKHCLNISHSLLEEPNEHLKVDAALMIAKSKWQGFLQAAHITR